MPRQVRIPFSADVRGINADAPRRAAEAYDFIVDSSDHLYKSLSHMQLESCYSTSWSCLTDTPYALQHGTRLC